MKVFERLYYHSALFANDMKHIHLHACGKRFDMIHNLTSEYYDKAFSDSDDIAEIALELGEKIRNPSIAREYLKYNIADKDEYYWEDAIEEISKRISSYIISLELVRNSEEVPSDIISLLDEKLRYWKKENNYKNNRRRME